MEPGRQHNNRNSLRHRGFAESFFSIVCVGCKNPAGTHWSEGGRIVSFCSLKPLDLKDTTNPIGRLASGA